MMESSRVSGPSGALDRLRRVTRVLLGYVARCGYQLLDPLQRNRYPVGGYLSGPWAVLGPRMKSAGGRRIAGGSTSMTWPYWSIARYGFTYCPQPSQTSRLRTERSPETCRQGCGAVKCCNRYLHVACRVGNLRHARETARDRPQVPSSRRQWPAPACTRGQLDAVLGDCQRVANRARRGARRRQRAGRVDAPTGQAMRF